MRRVLNIKRSYVKVASPTTQSKTLRYASVTKNSMTVSWTPGSGVGTILLCYTSNSFPTLTNNVNYLGLANSNYTLAGSVSSRRVIYSGSGSSVTLTGLSSKVTYYFKLISYNIHFLNPSVVTYNNIVSASTGSRRTK